MVLPATVPAIKPEMYILSALPLSMATACTYPRSRTSTTSLGIKYPLPQGSQPHTAVSNALYHSRLGTPILTSMQATTNCLTLLVAPTNTRWHVFSDPDTHITVEDITRHDDHSTLASKLPENMAGGAVCDVCDDGNDGEKVRRLLHYYTQPCYPAMASCIHFYIDLSIL